jgi:hypothetical protein
MINVFSTVAEMQITELIKYLRKEMKYQKVNSVYWNNTKKAVEQYTSELRRLRNQTKKVA